MHDTAYGWVAHLRRTHPSWFAGCNVLEIGSRNINGTVRDLFTLCDYTGLDAIEGPGVNVVSLAHEYDGRPLYRPFDTVISCECFEHDPYIAKTLAMIEQNTKPGAVLIATFAGPAREAHGTGSNPYGPDPSHYSGISSERWLGLVGTSWRTIESTAIYDRQGSEVDVYWAGRRNTI